MLSIKQLFLLPILDRCSKRAVHIDGARGWSAASSAAGGDGSEIDFVFVTPKIWCAYHGFLFFVSGRLRPAGRVKHYMLCPKRGSVFFLRAAD